MGPLRGIWQAVFAFYGLNIMSREADIIARGIDPRSVYPRCDFCAKKDENGQTLFGTVQLGRWWAHAECAANPDNRALLCVQLPLVDYSTLRGRRTNWGKLVAMKLKIGRWAHKRLAVLRHVAAIRGADLMTETAAGYE